MILTRMFTEYPRVNILLAKLKFLKSARLLFFSFSVLSFILGMGAASIAFLGISLDSAIAQIPSTPNSAPLNQKTPSQANVLFVNPGVGDDKTGNGSESAPVKTITHALRLANANVVIMLSTGTYSAETGEEFPLILKPGISIQGNPSNQGKDIIIQGGGDYLSRSFGGQNVTIVGANQALLAGVTVTNSNPRGYGLWIESSNPVVAENTFTDNTQDGISVSGNAAPTISKNYFDRNGANGITIAGNSSPQVKENVFHQTGFGINIAQNAAPIVIGNQIQNNRSGIIVQANARPILRNNSIQDNKEDGLVAIAQAMPDLGSASEPGGNTFQNNGRHDINASAAKQVISAAGNNLVSDRITGKVDINGTTALATPNSQPVPNNVLRQIPPSGEITFSAPETSETTNGQTSSISVNNPVSGQLNSQLLPLMPANNVPLSPPISKQPPTSSVAGFPTPSSLSGRQIPINAQPPDTPQLNYVRIDPNTIEFTAPESPSNSVAPEPPVASMRNQTQQPLPTLETAAPGASELLPLPNPNIPIVNTRNLQTSSASIPYGGNSARQFGIRYRVVVPLATDRDRDLVRSLAPGAFLTVWDGQRVMQAGVFSSEYNAKEMLKTLSNKGLRAIMEPLN
ncbi:Carbohydrate-binding/sugar hydrolysis domain-containing protein [Nostoc sp. DSM 114160]|jgi:parallel beta-helix repeat protein